MYLKKNLVCSKKKPVPPLGYKEKSMFIHLSKWHTQKPRNDRLMFISAYIFLYTDNVVMPSSHIINNHLKSEI